MVRQTFDSRGQTFDSEGESCFSERSEAKHSPEESKVCPRESKVPNHFSIPGNSIFHVVGYIFLLANSMTEHQDCCEGMRGKATRHLQSG